MRSGINPNKNPNIPTGEIEVFAKEIKINLTADQAEDYIEDAVRVLRQLQEKPEVVENAPEEK